MLRRYSAPAEKISTAGAGAGILRRMPGVRLWVMIAAARFLEPIIILCRLAALIPQLALHPFIRTFFPALDGSVIMNATSPMRDKNFRQLLCDRTLAAQPKASANVYDIGGTGQVSAEMDVHGRIDRARDVNPNSPRCDRLSSISQVPAGFADLLIMCRTIQYCGANELDQYLRDAHRALSPAGWLVVCGPEFSATQWVDRLFRFLYSRTSPVLAGATQNFRNARDTARALASAGFDVNVEHHVGRLGVGRSFLLFARPR